MLLGSDSNGDKNSGANYGPAMPYLFVSGIKYQIRYFTDWPLPPSIQFLVQQLGGTADLGAGHVEAAELLHDLGDLAGGHALHVHLCDGQL